MKQYILAALCVFLVGCSSHNIEIENTAASESINESVPASTAETVSEEPEETMAAEETQIEKSSADVSLDDYSGEWCYLNNADSESEGGVSLNVTISGQHIEAKLSAWSSNYNRLADADLSGVIQDHKTACRFDDDGRGHGGTVLLTLKDNIIQMEVSIDKDSANGDFTFPEGTTILQRKEVSSTASDEGAPIESDNTFPLSVYKTDGSADFYLSFDDTYEAVKKRLSDSAPDGLNNWEEYSEYTVLNKKEMWPLIKSEDDFTKYASIMYTMAETDRPNILIFIEEGESAPLCSALTSSPNVMSEKGIRCGDTVEDIKRAYGKGCRCYNTEKNIIYEYKTLDGYLRFYLDPESETVTEWGIDRYSFGDRRNAP